MSYRIQVTNENRPLRMFSRTEKALPTREKHCFGLITCKFPSLVFGSLERGRDLRHDRCLISNARATKLPPKRHLESEFHTRAAWQGQHRFSFHAIRLRNGGSVPCCCYCGSRGHGFDKGQHWQHWQHSVRSSVQKDVWMW